MRALRLTCVTLGLALVVACGVAAGTAHAAGGDVLWEDRATEGIGGSITTNASVVNGDAVFVAGTAPVPFVGEGRVVRAYAALTGRLLWEDRHAPGDRLDHPQSIASEGNAVFTAGSASLVNGMYGYFVRAYDRRSGRVLWEDVLRTPSTAYKVVVKNGRVIVSGSVGADSLLRAYNARTGALLWQERQGAQEAGTSLSMVVEGGRLFLTRSVWKNNVGYQDQAVRAYDPATGRLLWENRVVQTGGVVFLQTGLDAAGSRVFLTATTYRPGEMTSTFHIRAYDASTGEPLWETQRSEPGQDWSGWVSMSAQESRVFVRTDVYTPDPTGLGIGNVDVVVAGFDAMTGRELWEDRIDVGPTDWGSQIIASSDRVFVTATVGMGVGDEVIPLNLDYFVRAYEAGTGRVRWTDQIDTGISDWALAVATQGERVFVAGTLEGLFFVRAYDGR